MIWVKMCTAPTLLPEPCQSSCPHICECFLTAPKGFNCPTTRYYQNCQQISPPSCPTLSVHIPSHQISRPSPANSPTALHQDHYSHPTAHPNLSSASPRQSSGTPIRASHPSLRSSHMVRQVRRSCVLRSRRGLFLSRQGRPGRWGSGWTFRR